MGEEGNRELESELATLEKELKEYLEKLKKFEEIIEKGLEVKVQNKIFKISFTKENLQLLNDVIRILKGLIVLSLNIPNIEIKRLVQQKVLNLLKENLEDISTLINSEKLLNFLSEILEKAQQSFGRHSKTLEMACLYLQIPSLDRDDFRRNRIFLRIEISKNDSKCLDFLLKILALYGFLEEKLLSNTNLFQQIQEYKNFIENKFQELQQAKQQLEEFLKEETLKKFSQKFDRRARSLTKKIYFFQKLTTCLGIATAIVLIGAFFIALFFPIQGNIYTASLKITVFLFLSGLTFYLLRYTLKLSERQDEYRYKALVLSTFPALNAFLQDDEKRFELIQTLILENQKLQTLSGSKDDKLPIEELIQLLNLLKDKK